MQVNDGEVVDGQTTHYANQVKHLNVLKGLKQYTLFVLKGLKQYTDGQTTHYANQDEHHNVLKGLKQYTMS